MNCGTFGLVCESASCVSDCEPACDGKACGDDGCGGTCGTCPQGGSCEDGACSCAPVCLSTSELLLTDCTVSTCDPLSLVCMDGACVPL